MSKIADMENIIPLNWRSKLKEMEDVGFIDDDFYIYRNDKTKPKSYPFKMDMTICCICLKGEARGRIDLETYEIKAPAIAIIMPGQIMEHECCTEDFEGVYILMSRKFNDSLQLPERFSTFLSVRNNPVIPLNAGQFDAIQMYYTMVQRVIQVKDHLNRMEVIKHLTIAFYYGLGYYFHNISQENGKNRQEMMVRNFLKQVQIFHKQERKIEFYAGKLCLTPKYLSQTIKEHSGKSAGEWIDEYVVLEAKALLKSTNMTVQQISDELNFPSQSFFGKFFKRLTGLSPKAYRNKI